MAFLNSLIASSSQPRSASSMPRELCSSDRRILSCPRLSRPMGPQITRKDGANLPRLRRFRARPSLLSVARRRVVLPESLEVFVRLHGGLAGGVARLVARQAVGGAGEELADVAPAHGHHPAGGDGHQADDDQVLAQPLTRFQAREPANEGSHRRSFRFAAPYLRTEAPCIGRRSDDSSDEWRGAPRRG